jgi:hypothetical protein
MNWRESSTKLLGYPTVEHKKTKEMVLVGRRGEVSEYSPGFYLFIIYNQLAAKQLGKVMARDEECQLVLSESAALKALPTIQPLKWLSMQVREMNERHPF